MHLRVHGVLRLGSVQRDERDVVARVVQDVRAHVVSPGTGQGRRHHDSLKPVALADEHDKVDHAAPIDAQALDRALTVLLDQHPEGLVAAIGTDGLFVSMPASVPLSGQKLLAGRSALDLVAPKDVEVMITTWERARQTGAARVTVEPVNSPGSSARLHCFDVREHHGVFVLVVLAEDGAGEDVLNSLPEVPAVVTRFSTTRKSELAVLVAIDEATTQMLGWKPDEMLGQRSLEFIHPDDRERAVESWMEMLARPGQSNRARLRHSAATVRGCGWRSRITTSSTIRRTVTCGPSSWTSPTRWSPRGTAGTRAAVAPSRRSAASRGLPGRSRRWGGVRERAPGRDRRCPSLRHRP